MNLTTHTCKNIKSVFALRRTVFIMPLPINKMAGTRISADSKLCYLIVSTSDLCPLSYFKTVLFGIKRAVSWLVIFSAYDAEAKTKMKEIMEQINIDMGINYLDKKFILQATSILW